MIKVAQTNADQLVVVQSSPWVRVVGLALIAGAVAFALVPSAAQTILCEAGACVVEDANLVGMKKTFVIPSAEVKRIEVANTSSSDDSTYCVVIATEVTSHEVDRCSARREARLDELADELRGFYAGERASVERATSNRGIVAFPAILFGVMGALFLFLPRGSRAHFDRKRGLVTLGSGVHIPLADIETIALETMDGEAGPEQHLLLRLKDRRTVPIGEPTSTDLAPAKRAIDAFLASADRVYR
ncbi:MAG TPA: hypothetical protein VFB62_04610 [Polyangiaceae bacterium]|nr:hypothetical protein [Polyangiaceae bacterium]